MRKFFWAIAASILLMPTRTLAQLNPMGPFETQGHGITTQSGTSTPVGGLLTGLDECVRSGNCTICELFSVLSNAVNIAVAIAGGVALGFVLWIAFGLVGSRGNAEAVKAGRDGLWKLAIGFFFLLMSYELVILVIRIMSGNFDLAPPWKGLTCVRTVLSH